MDLDNEDVVRSADIPRAQAGANSQRLLAAILADYTFESAGPVPSSAIIRALADLGVTEPGARKALSRVTQRGLLTLSREGRSTFYRVADTNIAVRLERLHRYLNFGEHEEPWDGTWTVVVFAVGEDQRAARALLRAGLVKHGFAPLADAVWVRPRDARDSALALIERLEVRAAVMTSTFADGASLDPVGAFELDSVRAEYEELITAHEPVLDRLRAGQLTPPEAFALRARLLDSWRSVVIRDPELPTELLPSDWPRARARALFVELWNGLGPLALARLRDLVSESDPETAQRLTFHAFEPAAD